MVCSQMWTEKILENEGIEISLSFSDNVTSSLCGIQGEVQTLWALAPWGPPPSFSYYRPPPQAEEEGEKEKVLLHSHRQDWGDGTLPLGHQS